MKGFMHVVEILLVIMIVFFVFTQFASIPRIADDWSRVKLSLIGEDALRILERRGVDWFNREGVEVELNRTLPENVVYSVLLENVVKPEIRIGCLCDQEGYGIMEDILYPGWFYLNGERVVFELIQVGESRDLFDLDFDVALVYGFEDLTGETYALRNFLGYGKGVMEICDVQTIDSVQSGIFGLKFSDRIANSANSTFNWPSEDPRKESGRIYTYFRSFPSEIPNQGVSYADEGGIVSAWKFEGNLYDEIGGNDGTASGDLECTGDEGKVGGGCEFDGYDDYVEVADDPGLNFGSGDFSYCLWVKKDSGSETQQLLCKRESDGNNYEVQIDSSGKFKSYVGDSPYTIMLSQTAVSLDKWYHFCFTRDSGRVYLYVNGVLENSSTNTDGITSSSNLYFGRDAVSGVELFNGAMDEIAIYDRALSADEVYHHFYMGSREHGNYAQGAEISGLTSPGENVTHVTENEDKILLRQKVSGVASSVINYNVEGIGNGRTAWVSESTDPDSEEHRAFVKSLIAWAAGDEHRIVKSDIRRPVSSYIYKALNRDMFQLVKVSLELSYLY